MLRHIERWKNGEFYCGYPIPDYNTWLSNVEVMKDFARNRPSFQRHHIISYFHLSGSSVLNLGIKDPGMGRVQINDAELTDKNVSGTYFKDVPVELKAIPGVGYRFVKWEGISKDSVNPLKILLSTDSLTINALFDTISTNVIPSHISRDTSFTRDKSPYHATYDIVVDSNKTLTIGSGVRILMPENACIIVYGKLIIAGTAEDPVSIAPNEYSRNWGALCFVNATDSSIISNLKITGATRGHDFARDKAAISGYNSDFSVQNVAIENVDFPVFVQYGNVIISGCTLHTDATGDLITVKNAESIIIENCDLTGNDNSSFDAMDLSQITRGIVRGNRIYNFYESNCDAIDLGENCQDILIENNIIYNICDKGISIGSGSTATIKRNVIANCGMGAGIKDHGSHGYFENNTFYANQYGIACYEKTIGRGGGNADAVNCIFARSRSAPVLTDKLSHTNVSYSLSNTDLPDGSHNISGDPLFLNNLHLAKNSPAINSGNPSMPDDPDGSPPDMGAYLYDKGNQVNLIIDEIHYNPAEGNSNEFMEIVNAGVSSININGFQLGGNIDYTFPNETISAGEIFLVAKNKSVYQDKGYKVFQWGNGDLPDGPGSILLKNGKGDIIDFVNYGSRFWWPEEPDGQGPSLELYNTTLENMVSCNWRSSYNDGGTPGKSNSSVVIKGIYINEFLASNSSVKADENGDYADWIEFYNSTDKSVNLAGLYITDNLNNPYKYQIPNYSPELTTVPAKGFILFWADGNPDQGVLHLNFKLDILGEQIGLVQNSENKAIFIDSVIYTIQKTDVSYGRCKDGSEYWHAFDIPNPLQSNMVSNITCDEHLPENITLSQNYPNPFTSTTKIRYQLSGISDVELSVYDIIGRKINTLLKERQMAGTYEVEWHPEGISQGIYFCELKAGQGRKIIKMIMLK
jgi:hypothetical protein